MTVPAFKGADDDEILFDIHGNRRVAIELPYYLKEIGIKFKNGELMIEGQRAVARIDNRAKGLFGAEYLNESMLRDLYRRIKEITKIKNLIVSGIIFIGYDTQECINTIINISKAPLLQTTIY